MFAGRWGKAKTQIWKMESSGHFDDVGVVFSFIGFLCSLILLPPWDSILFDLGEAKYLVIVFVFPFLSLSL